MTSANLKAGVRISLLLVAAIPVLYVSSCTYISSTKNSAFESVDVGDAENTVIQKMGAAKVREMPDILFSRYASQGCQGSCAQRLWYENRLSLDTEAWSIELNSAGQVIKKAHWVSP